MSTAISCIVLVQTASVPEERNTANGLWRTAESNMAISLKFLKGKLGALFQAKSKQRNTHPGKSHHCLCKGSQASLDFFQQATQDTDKKDPAHQV